MVTLVSGVSPTVPVVLLAAAALLGVHFQLKRLYLLDKFGVDCPYSGVKEGPFAEINEADGQHPRSMLRNPGWRSVRRPVFCLIAIVALVVLWEFWNRWIGSVEGIAFDFGVWLAFMLVPILVLGALLRSLQLWRWIADLLHRLALLPMAGAYDRLPDKVLEVFGRYLANERPETVRLYSAGPAVAGRRRLLPETS